MFTSQISRGAMVAAFIAAQTLPAVADTAANTRYINSLNYKLDQLLSVDLRPTQQQLEPDRKTGPGNVTVCTKKTRGADKKLDSAALLDPGQGVIYPGAIVKMDGDLAEGRPTPYRIPRSALTLRVALPGIGSDGTITIDNPTNVSVPEKIGGAIKTWFNGARDDGYEPAIRAFSSAEKAFSSSQISVDLGFGAQWGNNSVTSSLKVNSTNKTTHTYQVFKQIYYSVIAEEPSQPGSVFSGQTRLDANAMPAGHPPGFVRSVDYGRVIIMQMTTNDSLLEEDAEGAMTYVTSSGVKLDGTLKQKYEKIVNNSTFQIFAIGGGVGRSADKKPIFPDDPSKFKEAVNDHLIFSERDLGVPISYTVADLKTGRTAQMRTTTSYVEQTCKTLANRQLKLLQRGGYVAKFTVSWMTKNADGMPMPKVWGSGKKTNPWDHTLSVPGDAQNIVVIGTNDTWLAWDPHRSVSWNFPVLDGSKCLRIGGTTLNMNKKTTTLKKDGAC